jgi:hypothetical protein
LDDPVYIHQGTYAAGIATTTNDVRLTAIGGKEPGTKVGNLDQDLPKIFSPPVPPNSPDPIVAGGLNPTPAGFFSRIRYVDINGNGQYDYPDDVYLITGAFPAFPAEPVKVNDVRLSGPAC